ncbi:hypothetical protein LOAG_04796, partial [Loa loa]
IFQKCTRHNLSKKEKTFTSKKRVKRECLAMHVKGSVLQCFQGSFKDPAIVFLKNCRNPKKVVETPDNFEKEEIEKLTCSFRPVRSNKCMEKSSVTAFSQKKYCIR